mgnify:FL=1
MVAFCDIIEERAVKAAKEFGVEGAKVYTDYRKLLEMRASRVFMSAPRTARIRSSQ